MKAKIEPRKVNTYGVSGKTLKDVWRDIQSKSPDPPHAGKSATPLKQTVVTEKDFDIDISVESTGRTLAQITLKPDKGEVQSSSTVTVPRLISDQDLSDAAKTEWSRYISCLMTHEQGHVDIGTNAANQLVKDLNDLDAIRPGKDEKTAKQAAVKAFFELLKKTGTGALKKLGDDEKAYDARTNHGSSQGAVLDTTIT